MSKLESLVDEMTMPFFTIFVAAVAGERSECRGRRLVGSWGGVRSVRVPNFVRIDRVVSSVGARLSQPEVDVDEKIRGRRSRCRDGFG